MTVKKHQLTDHSDEITGSAGKDLFIALQHIENYTLGTEDRIDGGKGIDTIRAEIGGTIGAPVLKSIENGIFTLDALTTTMDLANAKQMHNLTINSVDSANALDLTIDNAAAANTIRLQGGDFNDDTEIHGLDSKASKTLSLRLSDIEASIGLFTITGNPFKEIVLTLDDAINATVWGGALSARDVTIRSIGDGGMNQIGYSPGQYGGTTRHLTIEGNTSFVLINTVSEIFEHLFTVDLTGMKALSQLAVGGAKLTSVLGGTKSDFVQISDLGGSEKHKALVSLGAGTDGVSFLPGCFDAATQRFDGGSGTDSISFIGAVEDLSKAIKNFEEGYFYGAVGVYDMHGLDMSFGIGSTAGSVTIDRLKSGSFVMLLDDLTSFLTINVEGAATSKTDSVTMQLTSGMSTYGNSAVGLVAPSLSELDLISNGQTHDFYLTAIGSTTDGATLEISGNAFLTLHNTTGSTQYVDRITITNSKGVDLSGLEHGFRAIASDGATIKGGAGDDVLVGGIGFDTISTGAGDNVVLGSLGQDQITISLDAGANAIRYRTNNESTYGLGHDTILNFDLFDTIDVSVIGDVTFVGNFADNASGIAALSTSVARAFFNTTTDMLYIDYDHDKALGPNHDMQIILTGLESFSSSNLIS